MQTTDFTPYSTVMPLIKEVPQWLSTEHAERVAAYQKYEEIYWQDQRAFKLVQRGTEADPIYVPNPKTIVDSTSHYLLKGLNLKVDEKNKDLNLTLSDFLKREEFYASFMTAKHSGVVRGDFIFHMTADPDKIEGRRISLTSVDPGIYFPETDPDDDDKIVAVHLAQQYETPQGELRVKELTYRYEESGIITREEAIYELDGWGTDRQKLVQQLLPQEGLHPDITAIPVYHFKNIDWQGWPFGASELKGYERIAAAVNQAVSDEEVALALQGLGVYATDAGPPTDKDGVEMEWEIAPAQVMEVPAGSYFKRVEGVGSITPSQDHIKYLEERLFESSSTFRAGVVDVQVAASGIALSIRFLPQLAKIETRDLRGLAKLDHMFFDWKIWNGVFEGDSFEDQEIIPEIGDKLPQDRLARMNELNNMLDRKIISRTYYRDEMKKMGYAFPDDIENQILADKEADIELQRKTAEATGAFQKLSSGGNKENKSNNKGRPNESGGSEA